MTATAFLGAALALLGNAVLEFFKDRIIESRTRHEEHRQFQRTTLLDLQDAIAELQRVVAIDMMLRRSGQPPEIETAQTAWGRTDANTRVMRLRVRVEDDQLRGLVKEYWDIAHRTSEQELTRVEFDRASELFEAINERIGELLRQMG